MDVFSFDAMRCICGYFNSDVVFPGMTQSPQRIVDEYEIEIKETNDIKKLAIETSHPEWLLKMWEAHYGKEKMIEIESQAEFEQLCNSGVYWHTTFTRDGEPIDIYAELTNHKTLHHYYQNHHGSQLLLYFSMVYCARKSKL